MKFGLHWKGLHKGETGACHSGAGGHAPNRRLHGFFTEENWIYWDCSLYQKCSVGLKCATNALADPAGGAHDAPQTRSRLGRGTSPPQSPPPRRLRRLDSRAFGAQLLCPQCKILATPLGREIPTWSLLEKNPRGSDSVVAYWIKQIEDSVLETSSSSVKHTRFAGPCASPTRLVFSVSRNLAILIETSKVRQIRRTRLYDTRRSIIQISGQIAF